MKEREALKLAQKALSNRNAPPKTIYEALHAIKEVLAQPDRTTTPPQRTWVGLTDEDVREVSYDFPPSIAEWYDRDFTRFIHALEAKLKEKNT